MELAKAEPERFAEVQQRMKEMSRKAREEEAARIDVLAGIETEGMDEEQQQLHRRLVDTLGKIEQFEIQLGKPSETALSQDDLKAYFALKNEATALLEQDRRNLIENFGRACGYDGGEFADAIEDLYQVTSPNPGGRWLGTPQ